MRKRRMTETFRLSLLPPTILAPARTQSMNEVDARRDSATPASVRRWKEKKEEKDNVEEGCKTF
jgi:hypothetical protein